MNKHATQAVTRSRSAMESLVHEYPLLVAGFGAALGLVLAASVPASEAENRMLGAGSRRLKRTAQRVAAHGIETASDMASNAIAATAVAAVREGIHADGIRNAVGKVAESVTAVVERGLDTAIGKSEQAASSNSRSGQGTKHE